MKSLYHGIGARALALLMTSLLLGAWAARAAEDDGPREVQEIAAIVNDHPISTYDLEQYAMFLRVTSPVPETEESKASILRASLDRLIEDQIQLQEARRLSLRVPSEELSQAIDNLASRNRVSLLDFQKLFTENGIDLSVLESHIRADLAWRKVVERSIAPRILLSPQHVEETYVRVLEDRKGRVYLLAEIYLPSERAQDDDEARGLARQIHGRLEAGAPFNLVAAQFSEASSAANGGNLGWVPERSLDSAIRAALSTIQPGSISPPIRTDQGYYIFLMRDRLDREGGSSLRDRVTLFSLTLPSEEGSALSAEEEWRQRWRGDFPGCRGARSYAEERDGAANEMAQIMEADLSDALRERMSSARLGQSVSASREGARLRVLIFCGREKDSSARITRQSVEATLLQQRMDQLSRQRLRDLRREAHVELR